MPSTQGLRSFAECQALGEIEHQTARIRDPRSILSPRMIRKRKPGWLRRLKVLVAKTNHLSYIPRIHMVEGFL